MVVGLVWQETRVNDNFFIHISILDFTSYYIDEISLFEWFFSSSHLLPFDAF